MKSSPYVAFIRIHNRGQRSITYNPWPIDAQDRSEAISGLLGTGRVMAAVGTISGEHPVIDVALGRKADDNPDRITWIWSACHDGQDWTITDHNELNPWKTEQLQPPPTADDVPNFALLLIGSIVFYCVARSLILYLFG